MLFKKNKKIILKQAVDTGNFFKKASYFKAAENDIDWEWDLFIWPVIKNLDFSCVLDLAAGYGRNSEKLKKYAKKIIIVDIQEECINACMERFKGDDRFEFIKTNGLSLKGIDDNSITLVYSFDSMVHFHKDVIREYIKEFQRILKPGGFGFCHHSNYSAKPGSSFNENPHWRSDMSYELFEKFCNESKLDVVQHQIIDWGSKKEDSYYPGLDCITLFKKTES